MTSNRWHPGSSRTDARAFVVIAARNSSRSPGRTSSWTIRLNIRRPFVVAVCMQNCIQESPTREGAVMSDQRYTPEALREFGTGVLEILGLPSGDAGLVAESLVQADLWGHGSHGMLRLPWYAARLRSGAMTAVTDAAVLVDTDPLALLDGRDGVGQVLAERARVMAV